MADSANKEKERLQLVWSQNHNIFYASAFQIRFSETDIAIELGTTQNINGVDAVLSSHQLIMAWKSAKLLSIMLSKMVDQIEEQFGEITIVPGKIAALQAIVEEASKKIKAK